MATVTAIKQQLKRPDRYSVYLDGKYSLSLSAEQLAESSLSSGQVRGDAELEELQSKSQYGKALQAAYNLLSYRARSRRELIQRLSRKDYDEPTIDLVVERLSKLGLLDDQALTSSWVAQTKSLSRSQRRLQQELWHKGVDPQIVADQLQDNPEHDYQAIKLLVEKHLHKNASVDRRKLVEYLARQGFKFSEVSKVLDLEFSEVGWQ